MRWLAKDYSQWHPYFTWKPTQVKGEWVWGERVLRRGQKTFSQGKQHWRWEFLNSEFELMKEPSPDRNEAQSSTTQEAQIPNTNYINVIKQR